MHIYNVLLNKSFMDCLTDNKKEPHDIFDEIIFKENIYDEFFKSMDLTFNSQSPFNPLYSIFHSLTQEKDNIIIEIDFKNKTIIKFLTTKEFIDKYSVKNVYLSFISLDNKKILKIEYGKEENGCLLHFGKNTFVILKDINNKLSQRFGSIPIDEYKQLKKDTNFDIIKRTIVDIFNNQLVSNHLYGIGNIYINDKREFKLNCGKFYINDHLYYTEFNYKYKEDNNEYIYNFICLTDGKILSGNVNLQSAFTIGTLIKKEETNNTENTESKVEFELSQLNINNIDNIGTAIKSLGLVYMTRNILVNSEIILNNKNSINNIMSLITKYNIFNNYCFKDLKLINDFIYLHKDEIIEFKYNNKLLIVYCGKNDSEEISSIPYNILKHLLIYIIENKLVKDDKQRNDYIFKDHLEKTGFKQFDEKISNILTYLLSNDYYIIDLKDGVPKISNEKLSLNCSCYISFIPETYEIYLVIDKQIYSLYLANNSTLFIYKQNNKNIPKLNNNIIYKRTIDEQYEKVKNILNDF